MASGYGHPRVYSPEFSMSDIDQDSVVDLDNTEATDLTASEQIHALLGNNADQDDSEMAELETPTALDNADPSSMNHTVFIKQESPIFQPASKGFTSGDIIDLSDGEDIHIKQETEEDPFVWTSMPDEIVELSDSDSDSIIELYADEQSSASASKPGQTFSSQRPTSRPQRSAQAIERLRENRRAYMQRFPGRRSEAGIEASPGPSHGPGMPTMDNDDPNDDSWMRFDYTPDDDDGEEFQELKERYQAKVKKNMNTLDDDVLFMKAEKEERVRLARLETENEESLFLSPSPPRRFKRQLEQEMDGEGEEASSQSSKQRKPNVNRKRTDEDFEKERMTNMLAGIESYLHENRAKAETQAEGKDESGKKKKKAQRKKRGPKKPTQMGYLANSSSLLTSNVFDDADANFNREALPLSTETNKRKALADLVASVPIEERNKVRAQKEYIRRATINLGSRRVWADGKGGWTLKGMVTSLRHHQVMGASFMKSRENSGDEPPGGILAGINPHDAMGLGKTVMTIALCIANPPPRGEKSKCTLVVCAPGLLAQWEREISIHKEEKTLPVVLRHHSTNRLSGQGAVFFMENADIILTTYQEVVKSYPRPEIPENLGEDEIVESWKRQWEKRDVLHKVNFYRVVLDESQAIKNHVTQTSVACRALQAKHRWALSGTPIMNRIEELYPYFKFLRTPYTGCYKDFQDNYCIPGSSDCNARLHCLLDQIMCRRTLKDTILGKKIVDLPKHNRRSHYIEFSIVETAIYRQVFKKFVGVLNKASAEGKLEKHPGLGLVAFLRLRQIASHCFLAQEVLRELLDLEIIDSMEKCLIQGETPENENDRAIVAALRRMIEAKPEMEEERAEEPQQTQLGKIAIRFGKHLRTLKANGNFPELRNQTVCQKCGETPPQNPIVTSCLHVYCEECLADVAHKASEKDQDQTACLECGEIYTEAQSCEGLKELEFDEFWLLNESAGKKKRDGKVNMEWVSYDDKVVLSAKTMAVRDQVEKWLEEEPEKKIIIFSQFHMIMQILERLCQMKQWKYCTYHGKMSHKARDHTLIEFEKDKDMKIMIASLKCGGTGLNLTMASKVVCLDLWFNSSIEQQAFCRVFRIGQKSETFIARFIVNKSADVKLEEMQMKKNAVIGQAMDDKSVLSKLNVEEILRLFGEVRFDRNKKPFIFMEDDEKLDKIFEKDGKK